ncbi:MAG: cupin domain-containing protein [Anaerolineales bacterium]|nr:cupin domain-containing protein [Anaerolineales bacterium]
MYYFDPAERESKQLAPGILARTFWGEHMLAAVVDLEPHTELPSHSHPHEQLGIVIQGEIEFEIAGQVQRLGPGAVYVIPGGVLHQARTFEQPVQVLDVFSPLREEYQY